MRHSGTYFKSTPADCVLDAVYSDNRLRIVYVEEGKTWQLEATSTDGIHFHGNYGEDSLDELRHVEFTQIKTHAGERLFLGRWRNAHPKGEEGEWFFRLMPTKTISSTEVAARLFMYLRQMDAEATSITKKGHVAGLQDYCRHVRQDTDEPQCEVEWCRRLAELLSAEGIHTRIEVPYPGQKTRRDLQLQLSESQSMTIEVKGAWSDYKGRKNRTYRTWLLHPLLPNLDMSKDHSVPFDLRKLSALRSPETNFVGQLLIGFESLDDPMDEDVETLRSLANLSALTESSDAWDSPTVPGQRVRCWFWYKPADGEWTLPDSLRIDTAS